ncbi:MAG: phosphoribosylanthranilate isomerase [Bacteroidales bacterium]|nr:phosphoribosylanthranilate isomerase [Bacteroidales bacterium]
MKIKICGLRDNFLEVAALKPDFLGLIFYEKSPRFVPQNVDNQLKQKTFGSQKVGVFVNESEEKILKIIKEFNLDFVQLHGNETPDFCEKIREKIPVIKAFGVSSKEDLFAAQKYYQSVDYLLFDTKTSGFGGSGRKFDWSILNEEEIQKPFLLSGGIDLDVLDEIKTLKIKNLVGVDLNSRFEISPTLKDIEKLQKAIKILQ